MDEQLQKALQQLIEKSMSAFEQGADFMAGQLPEIITQLLLWYMVESGLMALSAMLLVPLILFADYKSLKATIDYASKHCDDLAVPMGWGLVGCFARVPAWIFIYSLWNVQWLQIWIAPKLWLIEYAAKLLGK